MPVNKRPSGWLYDGDPDYKGTTVAERRAMQNQWDLLAAQEEANRIEQQKLDFMILQEKRDKAAQELDQTINAILQRNEEEALRLVISCREIGINSVNFSDFMNLISDKPKVKVENMYDLDEMERVVKVLEEREAPKYPEEQLNVDEELQTIEELEEENNMLSNGFFNRLINKGRIERNKQEIEHIKKQIEKNKAKYIKYTRPKLIKEYNEKLEKYNKMISKRNELKKDFTEFRKSHYNKKVELLFKKLELKVEKIKVTEDKGTIEDFNNYFETKILEN